METLPHHPQRHNTQCTGSGPATISNGQELQFATATQVTTRGLVLISAKKFDLFEILTVAVEFQQLRDVVMITGCVTKIELKTKPRPYYQIRVSTIEIDDISRELLEGCYEHPEES